MFKYLAIYLFALLACATAKPHLLNTGVSYATPVITAPVAAAAVAHPVIASSSYYPAYTAAYATYPYASYATYPYFNGATYFVRR